MNKYKGILILSSLILLILFSFVNYFAFIFNEFPNGFWMFMVFEICCFTIVIILMIFAIKLDKILENEGYFKLSDEKLIDLKEEKVNIDLIMNTKNFLDTTGKKGKIDFEQIQPIRVNKKIKINDIKSKKE